VLHIRKAKFRKDRLVPVHATTRQALRDYAHQRRCDLSDAQGRRILPQFARQPLVAGRSQGRVHRCLRVGRAQLWQALAPA
jgi:integrase